MGLKADERELISLGLFLSPYQMNEPIDMYLHCDEFAGIGNANYKAIDQDNETSFQ